MASAKENEEFKNTLLPQYPLDDAIEWISKHMNVDEVFSEKQIKEAADGLGMVDPTEVDVEKAYGVDTLEEWARENGYEKIGKIPMSSFRT